MAVAHASTQRRIARSFASEDVIRQIYQDIKVKNLPLKVFLLMERLAAGITIYYLAG